MTQNTDLTGISSCRNRLLCFEEAERLNPLQLAYMGDSVWETVVRTRLILQKRNPRRMHEECVKMVNAAAQARHMTVIRDSLEEKELSIANRGRNTHAKHPAPKHQIQADYAEATGFESLFGYLYITGQDDRIRELADIIFERLTETADADPKDGKTGKAYGIRKRDIRKGSGKTAE